MENSSSSPDLSVPCLHEIVNDCGVPTFSTDAAGVVWFDVNVHTKYGEGWCVRRRYSQFLGLRESARSGGSITGTADLEVLQSREGFPTQLPKFPGKSWARGQGAWLEDRRVGLDKFIRCLFKGAVGGLYTASSVQGTEPFASLLELDRLITRFLEVSQNAERCRQQRADEARLVLRARERAASLEDDRFSDSESDGLSVTDSDERLSDCSWEDLSSEVSSLDKYMSSSLVSNNSHDAATLTSLRELSFEIGDGGDDSQAAGSR